MHRHIHTYIHAYRVLNTCTCYVQIGKINTHESKQQKTQNPEIIHQEYQDSTQENTSNKIKNK